MGIYTFRSLKELDATEGTVKLVDGSSIFRYTLLIAEALRLKTRKDIVLIPQPSDDINDPLNWPAWKKSLAFSTILVFTLLCTWAIGGVGAALVLLMTEFGKDLNTTVTGLVSWSILTLGVAVVIHTIRY